jgi:hypothetical protein
LEGLSLHALHCGKPLPRAGPPRATSRLLPSASWEPEGAGAALGPSRAKRPRTPRKEERQQEQGPLGVLGSGPEVVRGPLALPVPSIRSAERGQRGPLEKWRNCGRSLLSVIWSGRNGDRRSCGSLSFPLRQQGAPNCSTILEQNSSSLEKCPVFRALIEGRAAVTAPGRMPLAPSPSQPLAPHSSRCDPHRERQSLPSGRLFCPSVVSCTLLMFGVRLTHFLRRHLCCALVHGARLRPSHHGPF